MRISILLILVILLASCNPDNKQVNNNTKPSPDTVIVSGEYAQLHLAFNPKDSVITGYYEDGTGIRDTGGQQFSCIFYIEGKLVDSTAKIKTYFPADNKTLITGELKVISKKKINIKLQDDPGGCRMTGLRLKDSTETLPLIKNKIG